MTLRQYVVLMTLGTFLCWGAWFLVVMYLDPATAGWLGFGFFYSSLFLALVGSFSLIGLGFRLYILQSEVVFRQVSVAFRQALSFSVLMTVGLFLESKDLLTWWNAVMLVLAVTLVEFAVISLRYREA